MIYQIIFILLVLGIVLFYVNSKKRKDQEAINQLYQNLAKEESNHSAKNKLQPNNDGLSYSEKLEMTKKLYPFENWRNNFLEYQMEQYSEENCNAVKNIFETLIDKLRKLEENGYNLEKEKSFKVAILSLNELNEKNDGLIETGEREDLCELIDQITIASGLNPKEYADGEGIADVWREW